MSWHSLRVRPSGAPDAVIAALFHAGSQGVLEEPDAVLTHFPPDADLDAVRACVRAADPAAAMEFGLAADVDWSERWKDRAGTHELGMLTITPPWLAGGGDPARMIVIEPEMAFGTGEHPTTRGVVRLMQGVIRGGDVVADLGAGSAILAIAAAKLGASRVAAIELDPDAIANAEQNVARNDVADIVRVIEGDAKWLLPLVAPVRVVLANILSSVVIELLPVIAGSLTRDGQVILSGILLEERSDMTAALAGSGWSVDREDREELWWSALVSIR